MVRGKRAGVVIAGGGTAGCLAALALAKLRPDVPLTIVEERETFGGDRFRVLLDAEFDAPEAELVTPLAEHRWPGFYTAFPSASRKLKAEMFAFGPEALHRAMVAALDPKQYRLGTRVVAVRDDALVLDGGEELKAEGAIDARGAANLSMLDLLWETRLARDYRTAVPHRVDRPVLVDATREAGEGMNFIQCIPLDDRRLMIADVSVGELGQHDAGAGERIDRYLARRGWTAAIADDERSVARPLPCGGDFSAFWRIGGARVAKLGLRGGFLHPVTGRTIADAARNGLLLTQQRDFTGPALHDAFESHARQLWKRREPLRAVNATIAATPISDRPAILERLYALDAGLITRIHADRLGLLERRRIAQTVAGR